eukprot:GHRR01005555.1.p1 GENE.GHRR01005555.1~~GHRR01005555.1.p1  ORF type:complete len:448 (+),score=103.22 GHRR01005555.1:129-1472(+)
MGIRRQCLGALLLLFAGTVLCVSGSVIRGALPDQLDKYQPVNGKFRCFDGSRTIDFNQVNDNFCDCPDSSDEPGTSACPNGVFYCRNRGHEPKLLATSFVDDGICDCCDGTDELSGCKNTCIEKNSAKRDELKQKISEYRTALDRKAQYAASAAGVRENIKQRFQNVDGDIEQAEQELHKLSEDKKRIEEESEVKRAEHKKQQAELAARRKAKAEAAAAAEQAAAVEQAKQDGAAQAAADTAAAGQAAQQAEQTGDEQEETDEDRGRRIAAQWTSDPAAAGTAAPDATSQDEAANQHEETVKGQGKHDGTWLWSSVLNKAKDTVQQIITKPSSDTDQQLQEGEEPPTPDEEPNDVPEDFPEDSYRPDGEEGSEYTPSDGEFNADYQLFDDSELKTAISNLEAKERQLAELKAEKERVNRQVNLTFNDSWAGLLNKCLEARMPQFTYK